MVLVCVLATTAASAASVRGLLQVPPCRCLACPLPLPSASTPVFMASLPKLSSLQAPTTTVAAPGATGSATDPAAAPIYFPLLDTNLTSAFGPPGVGPFTGFGQSVTWETDQQFGRVLTCVQVGLSVVGKGRARPWECVAWKEARQALA